MQELKQGTPLQGGKYIIKRVLGQGGFGITYLAEQVSLGREVAVKEFFMKDSCVRDGATNDVTVPATGSSLQVERYREKFMKEARILASLNHPNIVSVIDVFEENGTVYYSMPYLLGGSLKDLVAQNGPVPENEALDYVCQIAKALKYMHKEHHICHFDVKPTNILLDGNRAAVLIDFGISKNYDSEGNETSSTPVGVSMGYAPIEQYQQMVSEFSPASDVYALGATLYFLITGTPPPTAVSIAQGAALEVKKNISSSTRELILNSMRISPTERPQDVDIFIKKAQDVSITGVAANIKPLESTPQQIRRNELANDETIIDTERKPNIETSAKPEKRPELMNWQVLFTTLIATFVINTISVINTIHDIEFWLSSVLVGGFSLMVLRRLNKESVNKRTILPALLLFAAIGYFDGDDEIAFLIYIPFVIVFVIIMSYSGKRTQNRNNNILKKLLYCITIAVAFLLIIVSTSRLFPVPNDKKLVLIAANIICVFIILTTAVIYHMKAVAKNKEQTKTFKYWSLKIIGYTFLIVVIIVCLSGLAMSNDSIAAKWYQMRAEHGSGVAQYELGLCYDEGRGVEKNYTEAVKWYRKAAEQGYSVAQNDLAVCYSDGKGVKANYTEAVKWYRKAAEQGNVAAQNNLAICYGNGKGVKKNYTEAMKWFRKAAENGSVGALNMLGRHYEEGWGVEKNYTEAVGWYRKAAEQGNVNAQYNLAVLYEEGWGVNKNKAQAVEWYRKAAASGDEDAKAALKRLGVSE